MTLSDETLEHLNSLIKILGSPPREDRRIDDLEDTQICEHYGVHKDTVMRKLRKSGLYKRIRVYDPGQEKNIMVWRKNVQE